MADIDTRRNPFHVAIENFATTRTSEVVRTANAFAVEAVHIVGRRRWNRRGAMVTDRYQRSGTRTIPTLLAYAAAGSRSSRWTTCPARSAGDRRRCRACLMVFGQEGPGVTRTRAAAALTVSIAQFGSTRSINAAVAAGIAMHAWIRLHADISHAW